MHLPDALHDLPSTVVFAVFMGVAGLLAAVACVVFAPVVRAPQTKEMLDVAMRTTGAITAALTLTLAFCAVQARSQMADAQRLVQAEVNAIAGLARMAHRIGAPGHALLPAISAYVAEIRGGELPAMAREGRHAATQRRAEALEDAVYAASPALISSLAEDLIDQADQVEATREARLQAAEAALPSQFWVLIMLLGALLVATGPLYPRRGHVVLMLAIQSAALAALVAFVFLMDQPFRGEFRVSAEPFHVLERSLEHRGGLAPARLVRH